MQKGWVAKCDASPLGLFSFQSAKQNPNFFSSFFQENWRQNSCSMKIKQMQKSSRKTTRLMPKTHAMPMDRGMHEDKKKKL